MFVDKVQVTINRALRQILNAYNRCHVSYLHFFTGLWRAEAMIKFKRIMALARWYARSEENRSTIRALETAEKAKLRYHQDTMRILAEYHVQREWDELRKEFNKLDEETASTGVVLPSRHSWLRSESWWRYRGHSITRNNGLTE